MNLILPVPVEKIAVGRNAHTFLHLPRIVTVQYVERAPRGSAMRAWHYYAHFDHQDVHPEAARIGKNGLMTAWIRRADHPLWKPPAFPDGVFLVDVREGGAA